MFTSTRSNVDVSSAEAILKGLAPDGGLFVPRGGPPRLGAQPDLKSAETAVLEAFFPDVPADVRRAAVERLLSRFPSDPVPLVESASCTFLELFRGPTGAFKDVALSMLPVLMAHAASAAGRERVLVLAATSGDTGSAAMAGFADCPGAAVAVFFPETGTSRIQRLQMTTPSAPNVAAFAIKGNFDDAQAAVKRIFSSAAIRREGESAGTTLSSANSINIGRLVPQIAYWLLAASRIGKPFDAAVPSGNFGNILAAYYAKAMGAPIGRLVCASNENRVLERFVSTGVYDPRPGLVVTNSPSMDIRRSSNVERLLWMLEGRDPGAVNALLRDLADDGTYSLSRDAFRKMRETFIGGYATQDETLAEMRRIRTESGYTADPHTAVACAVARKLGFPESGRPLVVAATATPYKFPETCAKAFGCDVLDDPPPQIAALETLPQVQNSVIPVPEIPDAVRSLF